MVNNKITDNRCILLIKTAVFVSFTVCLSFFHSMTTMAAETSIKPSGTQYQLSEKSKYSLSDASGTATNSSNTFGALTITGDVEEDGAYEGLPIYNVNEGNITVSYPFDITSLDVDETEWHITDDGGKAVDGIELDSKIGNGAIIIQSSLDGEKWVIESEQCNAFTKEADNGAALYSTNDIQLLNGCFYKVIVVYKEMQKLPGKQLWITPLKVPDSDTHKRAEVYEFYAINETEAAKGVPSSADEPRTELGEKVNTGKDNGFSEENQIKGNDPHFGWDLGTFTVNGYTDKEENGNGDYVFLKNAGDRITLWFTLSQDISKLNGNENLSIAEDKKGYDQEFEVTKTDFKHGALIMQYTDWQGAKHDPVIYTDYLAACARTGADTKIVLYEEGDYEVALDYVIEDNPRKIGNVSIVPSYTYYRINFKFSIHNGNTMLFPFDVVTGSELSDNAITPDGFRIDLANSRDLKVYVQRTIINEAANRHTTDIRENKPARDGEEYTQPGIYKLTVSNSYTDQETVKTIYIGSDPFIKALATTGLSVSDIDGILAQGYTLEDDGSLIAPVVEEVQEEAAVESSTIAADESAETGTSESSEVASTNATSNMVSSENSSVNASAAGETIIEDSATENKKSAPVAAIVIFSIIIVATVVFISRYFKNKKVDKDNCRKDETTDTDYSADNKKQDDSEKDDAEDNTK
ncbi:MAG: hypothetical protein GX685_10490 [Clostridiales bacterium]|nr:hypothetical protein [Clostridiales bacterium]